MEEYAIFRLGFHLRVRYQAVRRVGSDGLKVRSWPSMVPVTCR
jgi:hypothetical protein